MGAEMQHRMGAEILAQPAVEGRERVRRREALLEQQPHRIAFVAEGGLDADEDVAEALAEHEDGCCRRSAGCPAPGPTGPRSRCRWRSRRTWSSARDARVHVGVGAEARGVAVEDALAQRVDAWPARRPCSPRAASPAACCSSDSNTDRKAAVPVLPAFGGKLKSTVATLRSARSRAAQVDQPADARGQHVGALDAAVHVVRAADVLELAAVRAAGAGDVARAAAAAEDHRAGRAVELGDRDHHRRLDRQQAARRARPTGRASGTRRVGGEVGHVEPRQDLLGAPWHRCRPGRRRARSRSATPPRRSSAGRRRGRRLRSPGARRGRWRRPGSRAGRALPAPRSRRRSGRRCRPAGRSAAAAGRPCRACRWSPRAAARRAARPCARLHARVIEADLGVLDRRVRLQPAPRSAVRGPSA